MLLELDRRKDAAEERSVFLFFVFVERESAEDANSVLLHHDKVVFYLLLCFYSFGLFVSFVGIRFVFAKALDMRSLSLSSTSDLHPWLSFIHV